MTGHGTGTPRLKSIYCAVHVPLDTFDIICPGASLTKLLSVKPVSTHKRTIDPNQIYINKIRQTHQHLFLELIRQQEKAVQ